MAVICNILAKALMALPAPDFQLCTFLIPEPLLTPKILKLFRLSTMLERAAFAQVPLFFFFFFFFFAPP